MQKTGKSFDMNPDTFTLENLFAMELHNYKDAIADIVTSASKELSIEKVPTKTCLSFVLLMLWIKSWLIIMLLYVGRKKFTATYCPNSFK